MLVIIQRVSECAVVADGNLTADRKGPGLLVLLGVAKDDSEHDADLLAEKVSKLRIFSDETGKMNLSVLDMEGYAVVVSNFTLCGSYRRGNRPDFMNSADPETAERLYGYFIGKLGSLGVHVSTGVFGADMKISMTADGPVTMQLDSEVLKAKRK